MNSRLVVSAKDVLFIFGIFGLIIRSVIVLMLFWIWPFPCVFKVVMTIQHIIWKVK